MGVLEIEAAKKAAGKSRKFTERMMKNVHQWEVQDLIAAGLNPILSATGGSPSIGGSPAPSVGGDAVSGFISSARDIAEGGRTALSTKSQLEILEMQTTTAAHEAKRVGNLADAEHHRANTALAESEIRENERLVSHAQQANKLTEARSIRELDRTGVQTPFGKLTGAESRKLNAIIQRFRGTSAKQ